MSGGRHRRIGLGRGARITILAIVLVAAGGGAAVWRGMGQTGGCAGEEHLTIAAAPEIQPAIERAATTWAATARGAAGACVTVEVKSAAPADVALSIATAGGVVLTGLTRNTPPSAGPTGAATTPAAGPVTTAPAAVGLDPTAVAPDVWVPDSSTWLMRARTASPGLAPAEATTIATSPIVVAMPEPLASAIGWPARSPTWSDMLQLLTQGAGPHLGVVEPNRDAVGLASLMALGGAAATLPDGADEATVAVMRALYLGRKRSESDLFASFPQSADPQVIGASVGAAPLSERSLIRYNATSPAVRLAPLYLQPAPPALDYPYAVMPGISADRARLAGELRDTLTGETYLADLAEAGLRGPDGSAGFPAMVGAPASITTGALQPEIVTRALSTWLTVIRPGRMLAIMDVSGSMGTRAPGGGGATRGEIAIQAARQGVQLFDDTWTLGLWVFATHLAGPVDYLEVLPMRPMPEQRPYLDVALSTIRPVPGGGTGLYDTVLAAYQEVQRGYDPNAVNSVVMLTDGRNDDPGSMSLDQLVAELREIMDPRYQVLVILIGIGDGVSRSELETITNTTGGGTFIAQQPSDIGGIFLQAVSLRPAVPGV